MRPSGRPDTSAPVEGAFTTSTGQAAWVPEHDGSWTLYVNGVPSSPVRVGDPAALDFEYLQWMADVVRLVLEPTPDAPLRAVHLGGGACALPRHLSAVRREAGQPVRQVVVELDAELATRVREWVDLPRSPELRIQTGDARAGLASRRDASADLVVRDVFAGDSTPRHVSTAEFLRDVDRVLAPGGLYLANTVDRTSPVGIKAEVATLRDAFPHTAAALEPGVLRGRRHGNAVLLGSRSPLPVAALTRVLGAGAAPARLLHGEALEQYAAGAHVVLDPAPAAPAPAPAPAPAL
ncbi:spermidine synthase [Quadrisphaera oryzae]|uniref:spermidine synthase n=1 Tax=Quadrisphaera TaxID=317661 RepID=UPI001C967D83